MKTMHVVATAAVVVATLGIFGSRAQAQTEMPPMPPRAPIGSLWKPAPDFTLTDQNGKTVKLSDFKDKIIVLEWTNPDCQFVQRHYKAGTMQELAKKYAEKGVVWLAINSTSDSDQKKNAAWATEQKIEYPVLDDHEGTVGKAYGAKTSLHMFIVNTKGHIVYRGAIDNNKNGEKTEGVTNYVAQTLNAILEGDLPPVLATQPYGCAIKYAPAETPQ